MKPLLTTGNVPQMLLHNSESRRDELANVDVEAHMQDTTAINKAIAIFSQLATNMIIIGLKRKTIAI